MPDSSRTWKARTASSTQRSSNSSAQSEDTSRSAILDDTNSTASSDDDSEDDLQGNFFTYDHEKRRVEVWFEYIPSTGQDPPKRIPRTEDNSKQIEMSAVHLNAEFMTERLDGSGETFGLYFDNDDNPQWLSWHPETKAWSIQDIPEPAVRSVKSKTWVPGVHAAYASGRLSGRTKVYAEIIPVSIACLNADIILKVETALLLDKFPEHIFQALLARHVPKRADLKWGCISSMRFIECSDLLLEDLSSSSRSKLLYTISEWGRNTVLKCLGSEAYGVLFDEDVVRWFSCSSLLVSFPIIHGLAYTPNKNVHGTLLAEALVGACFEKFRWVFVCDWTFHAIFLACLSYDTYLTHHGNFESQEYIPLFAIMMTISLSELIAELSQFAFMVFRARNGTFQYLVSDFVGTAWDWLVAVSSFICAWYGWPGRAVGRDARFVACLVIIRWFDLLISLLVVEPIGIALLPIVSAISDAFVLLVALIFILVSGSHAHYALSQGGYIDSFLAMYNLGTLGDFDIDELQGFDVKHTGSVVNGSNFVMYKENSSEKHVAIILMFLMYSSLCTVLVMNVLVGVLSTAYDSRFNNGKAMLMKYRASELAGVMARMWHKGTHFIDDEEGRLWITVPNNDISKHEAMKEEKRKRHQG